jgi:hypothetical protein
MKTHNTYAPNPDWPACKALVENEYRRMLGVKKIIWVPTGMIEDTATFRGALAQHIHVPRLNGLDIPHAGVYTMFGVNGHADEFLRFVTPNTAELRRRRGAEPRGRACPRATNPQRPLRAASDRRSKAVSAGAGSSRKLRLVDFQLLYGFPFAEQVGLAPLHAQRL